MPKPGKRILESFNLPRARPNYNAGEILKKTRFNADLKKFKQTTGLVTKGVLEVTQVSGGVSWAISDYIPFGYYYVDRPIFTSGLDGTPGITYDGDNVYSETLPTSISALTNETYQPAMFLARVCHWHIVNGIYIGCYILVCQLNDYCTETNKDVRVHYQFDGTGFSKEALTDG